MSAVVDDVTGAKGGKGGGGGHVPQEDPNTLRSAATARVVDLLGEGEIKGLVDGLKSIYYDDTPIQNDDGSFNYNGLKIYFNHGLPDQPAIPHGSDVEREIDVNGTQVTKDTPIVRTVTDPDVDSVRFKIQVPALTYQDPETGDMHGASVQYALEIKPDGAANWSTQETVTIDGKTTSPYQRATRITLSGSAPWQIRVRRITDDSTQSNLRNDTYWISFTEIIDAKLIYPDSAVVGVEIDARQFGSDIPSRKYDVYGLIVQVPSNYDPVTREYSGLWDGLFKRAWTDNAAWCCYDLIKNTRYGARLSSADKWAFYDIGKYSDELIDDGFGGKEPRFTFNTVIAQQSDVYSALNQMASVFRGMMYWGTNTVIPVADKPGVPVKLVTPANVINGEFEYSGAPLSQRHTVALVSYNDPESNDRLVPEVVEYPELIEKFGWRPLDITAVACNSRGQAHRVGAWALDSEQNEGETVTYRAATDHADVRPGDLIQLSDPARAGARVGGRILVSSALTPTLDEVPVEVDPTSETWYLDVVLPSGVMERREVASVAGKVVTLAAAFTDTPVTGAVWMLSSASLEPRQFRVVANREQGDDDGGLEYQITAIEHDPTKYARIEQGIYLPQPDTSLIPTGPIAPPQNLTVESYTYIAGGTPHQGMTISLTPSDDPRVVGYIIETKGPSEAGWSTVSNSEAISADLRDIEPGVWQVRAKARTGIGRFSAWLPATETVNGLLEPGAPTGFDYSAGTFSIQIRPKGLTTGATWEYWMSTVPLQTADIESNARLVGEGASIVVTDPNVKPNTQYYFYIRGKNFYGVSAFVPLQIATKNDPSTIMDVISGEIAQSDLAQDLADEIDLITGTGPGSVTDRIEDLRNNVESIDLVLPPGESPSVATQTYIRVAEEAAERVAAVTAETQARIDAITAESTARQDAIQAEIANRTNDVNDALSQSLAAVDAEEAARIAALQSEVDSRIADVQAEETARIQDVQDEAAARAQAILGEQTARTAAITSEATIRQGADDSLATQIAQVAAGTGIQFDTADIWYFDAGLEGWTGGTVSNGAIKSDDTLTPHLQSPTGLAINGDSYAFVKARIKKTGAPTWIGEMYWPDGSGNLTNKVTEPEPPFDVNGYVTMDFDAVTWAGSIDQIGLTLANNTATDYIEIDWIAVGRPAPGASTAALQEEVQARASGDSANATARETLAAQIRGNYSGTDPAQLVTGLLYNQRQAQVTANSAVVSDVTALEATVNDPVTGVDANASAVSTLEGRVTSNDGDIDSHTTAITALENTVDDPVTGVAANASAITSIGSRVTTNEGTIGSHSGTLAILQNDVTTAQGDISANTTALEQTQTDITANEDAINATSGRLSHFEAEITSVDLVTPPGEPVNANTQSLANAQATESLTATVTQQGDDITSNSTSLTTLQNDLTTTQGDVTANSEAISTLDSQVTSNDGEITTNAADITTLKGTVNDPQTGVTALNSAVDTLGTRITSNDGDISTIATSVTALESTVDDPVTGVNANNSAINQLDSRVTVNDGVLTNHTSDISTLQANVSGLQGDTGANAGAISTLDARVTANDGDISSVSGDVTALQNDVTSLQSGVSGNSSAISGLQSQVTSNDGDITSIASDVTALENTVNDPATGVAANASGLSTLETTVTQHGDDITANTSDVTALQTDVTAAQGDISGHTSAISALDGRVTANGGDITAQAGDISALQSSVTDNTDNISTNATALSGLTTDVSTLQGETTATSQDVTALESRIQAFKLQDTYGFETGTEGQFAPPDGWALEDAGTRLTYYSAAVSASNYGSQLAYGHNGGGLLPGAWAINKTFAVQAGGGTFKADFQTHVISGNAYGLLTCLDADGIPLAAMPTAEVATGYDGVLSMTQTLPAATRFVELSLRASNKL